MKQLLVQVIECDFCPHNQIFNTEKRDKALVYCNLKDKVVDTRTKNKQWDKIPKECPLDDWVSPYGK